MYTKNCFSLYFRNNMMTCLNVSLLRICQVSPVCCKTPYRWDTTDGCFMSDMIYAVWEKTPCLVQEPHETQTHNPKSRALFPYSTRTASNSLHERPCHSPLPLAPPQATSSAARSVTAGSAAHDAAARNARGKISLKGLTRLTTIRVPLPPPVLSIKLHFRSQCSSDTFICWFPASCTSAMYRLSAGEVIRSHAAFKTGVTLNRSSCLVSIIIV